MDIFEFIKLVFSMIYKVSSEFVLYTFPHSNLKLTLWVFMLSMLIVSSAIGLYRLFWGMNSNKGEK